MQHTMEARAPGLVLPTKRRKSGPAAAAGGGPSAPLPTVPEFDVLEGTGAVFRTAGGALVEVALAAQLQAANFFGGGGGGEEQGEPLLLPTGGAWPILPIVTPHGLQAHFVQPEALDTAGIDYRDPRRLAMSKRGRAGEE